MDGSGVDGWRVGTKGVETAWCSRGEQADYEAIPMLLTAVSRRERGSGKGGKDEGGGDA